MGQVILSIIIERFPFFGVSFNGGSTVYAWLSHSSAHTHTHLAATFVLLLCGYGEGGEEGGLGRVGGKQSTRVALREEGEGGGACLHTLQGGAKHFRTVKLLRKAF